MKLRFTSICKYLLTILCLLNYCFSNAQQDFELYGMALNGTTGNMELVKIDPNTGATLSSIPWENGISGTIGTTTMDYRNKQLYDVVTDPWNMHIIRRNIPTGAVIDTVFTQDSVGPGKPGWTSGEITGVFYNCYDGHVYFGYNTPNKKVESSKEIGTRIAKINPITKQVTLVAVLPGYYFMRNQYCDPLHQKIFFSGFGENSLNSLDLKTGKLSGAAIPRNYIYPQYLTVVQNANDNQLYGFEVTPLGKSKIVRIDPEKGNIEDLSKPLVFNSHSGFAFNKATNKLYFCEYNESMLAHQFVSFDLDTREFTYHAQQIFIDLWAVPADMPDTTFKAKNFCQHTTTEFTPGTRYGSIQWDFGDPASGKLNSSGLANASHFYVTPGTYEVTMTSTSCSYTNTIKKKITIEPFQKVDLGNDLTWCEGKKNEELYLELNASGATYLWQDQSKNPFYTIREPGKYWVKVSSSCGEVSDSLSVGTIQCPCPITVAPTYTTAYFTVTLDCEPSYYDSESLLLELFDAMGKQLLQKEIMESVTTVNMESFRTAVYFYRIRSKTETLNSGKLMFVDH